jgi:septin family protein
MLRKLELWKVNKDEVGQVFERMVKGMRNKMSTVLWRIEQSRDGSPEALRKLLENRLEAMLGVVEKVMYGVSDSLAKERKEKEQEEEAKKKRNDMENRKREERYRKEEERLRKLEDKLEREVRVRLRVMEERIEREASEGQRRKEGETNGQRTWREKSVRMRMRCSRRG